MNAGAATPLQLSCSRPSWMAIPVIKTAFVLAAAEGQNPLRAGPGQILPRAVLGAGGYPIPPLRGSQDHFPILCLLLVPGTAPRRCRFRALLNWQTVKATAGAASGLAWSCKEGYGQVLLWGPALAIKDSMDS